MFSFLIFLVVVLFVFEDASGDSKTKDGRGYVRWCLNGIDRLVV